MKFIFRTDLLAGFIFRKHIIISKKKKNFKLPEVRMPCIYMKGRSLIAVFVRLEGEVKLMRYLLWPVSCTVLEL